VNKAIIITISDSCAAGAKEDTSGKLLLDLLTKEGFEVISKVIIPDEKDQIIKHLTAYSAAGNISLIITIGGTGIGPRDVTPEATKEVIEKEIIGIPELMRLRTSDFTPFAYLSRAVAGIRNETLIINFPGNPKAVQECFDSIKELIHHSISMIKGEPH